jgi:hypothetical protein
MNAEDQAQLRAILLSAGGNDVAGEPGVLKELVSPKQTNGPLLDEAKVRQIVDERLYEHVVTLLVCVGRAASAALKRQVPILLHGYDYPVADRRGFLGRHWLHDVLIGRGYTDLGERVEIMKLLIDRLNKMQQHAARDVARIADVRHVELRGALSNGTDYKLDWQNELHPTIPLGFGKVSARFVKELAKLERSLTPAAQAGAPAPGASASPSTRRRRSPASAGSATTPSAPGPA